MIVILNVKTIESISSLQKNRIVKLIKSKFDEKGLSYDGNGFSSEVQTDK